MKQLSMTLTALAAIFWFTSAKANLPSPSSPLGQQVAEINFQIKDLNAGNPDLKLKSFFELTDTQITKQTLSDLKALYEYIYRQQILPAHSLKTLTCKRAVCFSDDGED